MVRKKRSKSETRQVDQIFLRLTVLIEKYVGLRGLKLNSRSLSFETKTAQSDIQRMLFLPDVFCDSPSQRVLPIPRDSCVPLEFRELRKAPFKRKLLNHFLLQILETEEMNVDMRYTDLSKHILISFLLGILESFLSPYLSQAKCYAHIIVYV